MYMYSSVCHKRTVTVGREWCTPAGMVDEAGNVAFEGCINVVVFVQGKKVQPQPLL